MSAGRETDIDVEIPEDDLHGGALQVLQVLRPDWKPEDVKFLPLTEGITNKLVGCYRTSDPGKADGIVMRVYGQKTDLIIDRALERQNMQILHAAGCSAPFYAGFRNGISYAFVPGRSLEVEDVSDPHISRLIAREMAKMHVIDTDKVSDVRLRKDPCLWRKSKKYLDISPGGFPEPARQELYKKSIPSKEKLAAELAQLEKELSPFEAAVGFCHNDILVKNIIYNKDTDKVTLIDYEYGAYNYCAYDIGNHFNEFAGVETVDYNLLPSEEFKAQWIRHYLQARAEFRGNPPEGVTDKHVQTLRAQANKFSLASHLFWGIWALIQAKHSLIDFDYLDYAKIRLDEYFAKKEAFLALKLPQ